MGLDLSVARPGPGALLSQIMGQILETRIKTQQDALQTQGIASLQAYNASTLQQQSLLSEGQAKSDNLLSQSQQSIMDVSMNSATTALSETSAYKNEYQAKQLDLQSDNIRNTQTALSNRPQNGVDGGVGSAAAGTPIAPGSDADLIINGDAKARLRVFSKNVEPDTINQLRSNPAAASKNLEEAKVDAEKQSERHRDTARARRTQAQAATSIMNNVTNAVTKQKQADLTNIETAFATSKMMAEFGQSLMQKMVELLAQQQQAAAQDIPNLFQLMEQNAYSANYRA